MLICDLHRQYMPVIGDMIRPEVSWPLLMVVNVENEIVTTAWRNPQMAVVEHNWKLVP